MKKIFPIIAFAFLLLSFFCPIIHFLILFSETNPNCVRVGIFYYVWYNGTWENYIVDKPILGYYNSCEPNIINQHFKWLTELKLDFVLISWWGIDNKTDKVTKEVFRIVDENGNFSIKLAILVEPFNETDNGYNFTQIYSYIYENFVEPYPYLYYKLNGKPLVCFFNDEYLTDHYNGEIPKDDRFTVKIVGTRKYVNWVHPCYNSFFWENEIPRERVYTIAPRYDDTRIPNRTGYVIDPDYSQGYYQKEWKKALNYAENSSLDIILINSWNEFAERTQIEPCRDATSIFSDSYHIFNLTKNYISELKNGVKEPSNGYDDPLIFIVIALLILTVVIFKIIYDLAKR